MLLVVFYSERQNALKISLPHLYFIKMDWLRYGIHFSCTCLSEFSIRIFQAIRDLQLNHLRLLLLMASIASAMLVPVWALYDFRRIIIELESVSIFSITCNKVAS